MAPKVFVPPLTIRVRIVGNLSRNALYSNPRNGHNLSQVPVAGLYDDQWFYVIPGTGDKASLYRLKSVLTGEAIYMSDSKVGTSDFDAAYGDQFLSFEAGTGLNVGNFRITCPLSNSVLFSRAGNPNTPVGRLSSDEQYDDQWFTFFYEDMELEGIDYRLNEQKILETQPAAITSQKVHNKYEVPQTQNIQLSEKVEEESTFSHELGTKLGVSATTEVGIPLVAEAKVSVTAEVSTSIAWGTTKRISKAWSSTVAVTCLPGKDVKVYATARQTKFTVPFTATWKSKSTGQTMTTEGEYQGVSVYDFETTYGPA